MLESGVRFALSVPLCEKENLGEIHLPSFKKNREFKRNVIFFFNFTFGLFFFFILLSAMQEFAANIAQLL